MDTPVREPPVGGVTMAPAMTLALDANFGSVEHWRDGFAASAKALAGSEARAMLVFRPREGMLASQWATEHAQAEAGAVPLLTLELAAHRDPLQHGAAIGADVEAFMARIDWAGVHARYQDAVHAASEPIGAEADALGDALLLDVRRAGVFEQASSMIPGARWCDPTAVAAWGTALPAARELVVYCVHGHEVSRATALRLRAAGLNSRFLRGGIARWQAAGRPLADKP